MEARSKKYSQGHSAREKKSHSRLNQLETYQIFFQQANDVLFIATIEDDRFVDINQAGLDLFCCQREELLRVPVSSLFNNPLDFQTLLQRLLSHGRVEDALREMRRITGQPFFCLINAVADIDSYGRLVQIQGSIRNISDQYLQEEVITQAIQNLRHSESKLRAVVGNIPGIIYRSRTKGSSGMEFLNGMIETFTGVTAHECAHDPERNFLFLINELDRERVIHVIEEALFSHKPYSVEYRLRHLDGSERWVVETGRGEFDSEGNLLGLDGAIFDISEQMHLQQKLELVVSELQAALAKVKTLSGFLAICANCKKIRDDKGYWTQVEEYISQHSQAVFSHSVCPECALKLYPEIFAIKKQL